MDFSGKRSPRSIGPCRALPSTGHGYSETYLRGRITGALGGRAAEEVIYGDVTTGAARRTVSHRTHPARSEKSSAERAGYHAPAGG